VISETVGRIASFPIRAIGYGFHGRLGEAERRRMGMFESLTNLITTSDDGEGLYARIEREVRAFVDAHHEYDFDSYEVILEEHGILSDWQSMADADVSGFDDKAIMALLVGAFAQKHNADLL
jgi:hypothetical protein